MTNPHEKKYPGIFAAVASFFRLLKGLPDNPVFHASKPWRRGWFVAGVFYTNLLFALLFICSRIWKIPFMPEDPHLPGVLFACVILLPISMLILYKDFRRGELGVSLFLSRMSGGEIFFGSYFWPALLAISYIPILASCFQTIIIPGSVTPSRYMAFLICVAYYSFFIPYFATILLYSGERKMLSLGSLTLHIFLIFCPSAIASIAVMDATDGILIQHRASVDNWKLLLIFPLFFLATTFVLVKILYRNIGGIYFRRIDPEISGLLHTIALRKKYIKDFPLLLAKDVYKYNSRWHQSLKSDAIFCLLPILVSTLLFMGNPTVARYTSWKPIPYGVEKAVNRNIGGPTSYPEKYYVSETNSYSLTLLIVLPLFLFFSIASIHFIRAKVSGKTDLLQHSRPLWSLLKNSWMPILIYTIYFVVLFILFLLDLQNIRPNWASNKSVLTTQLSVFTFGFIAIAGYIIAFEVIFYLFKWYLSQIILLVTIYLLFVFQSTLLSDKVSINNLTNLTGLYLFPIGIFVILLPIIILKFPIKLGKDGYRFIRENAPACYERWLAEKEVGR